MSQKTNLNVSPYYDDFDKDKNFQNILFRPGYAVQAREMSQIQSLLKHKIEKVGDHLFEDGAMVVPGQLSLFRGYTAIRIQNSFAGETVDLSKYVNATTPVTITGVTSGVTAVIYGHEAATSSIARSKGSAHKLHVNTRSMGTKPNGNSTAKFIMGEELKVDVSITHETTYPANVPSLQVETVDQLPLNYSFGSGPQCAASIEAGVYYIRGTFVEVAEEVKILTNEGNKFTGRIGLKVTEEIITPEQDSTLTDNSTGSSNYAANGAHRLKISAKLHSVDIDDVTTTDFIELMRVTENKIQAKIDTTGFGSIAQTMARRTHDESGNYTVRPFQFEMSESVDLNDEKGFYTSGVKTQDGVTANTSLLALKTSPGRAYIQGFVVNQIAPIVKDIDKARDFNTVNAGISTFSIGNYAQITKIYGTPDIDFISGETTAYKICKLYDTRTATRGSASGTLIGAARIRTIEYLSGTAGSTASATEAVYKAYLFDIRPFTALTLSGTPSATLIANHANGGVQVKGVTSNATGWVFAEGTSSTNCNLTNVSGTFVAGEKITASDSAETDQIVENSSNADLTISSLVTYTFADVKQLYMQDAGATASQDFTADIDLTATKTLSGTYVSAATAGATSLTGVAGYDTSEVKIGDVLTIATGTAGATQDRIVDAITATTISFTVAPSTVNTGSVVRKRAKLYDTEKNLSLIKLPKNTVKTHLTATNSGTSDSQYTLRKQFVVEASASGVVTLSAGTNETFISHAEKDYTISILTAGSGSPSGVAGDLVTATGKVSGAGTGTLTITDNSIFGNGAKVKVVATLLKTSVSSKTKTVKLAKQLKVEKEAATDAYGTRPEDKTISLGRADVFKLVAVFDSENTSIDAIAPEFAIGEITGTFIKGEVVTGGTSGAKARIIDISSPISYVQSTTNGFVVGDRITGEKSGTYATISSLTTGHTDITKRYLLDTGQRDNYYDISRIERKPGAPAPTGDLLVIYDYMEHGTGAFFTVDSYNDVANQMTYEDIPTYSATKVDPDLPKPSGEFPLYDVFDFRPRCEDIAGTSSIVDTVDEVTGNSFDINNRQFDGSGSSTTNWPQPNSTVQSDFEYYLPRYDVISMNKLGNILVTKGASSEVPMYPPVPDNNMKLCSIALPAYTFSPKDVGLTREKNQRFTMQDIGKLQDRVENIEYYTAMSLLERDAESYEITDANGLNRFKSGFIVDNFAGHKIGDTEHPDYNIAMDGIKNHARPTFSLKGIDLEESLTTDAGRTGAHYQKTGDLLTLPYKNSLYTTQPFATRLERIDPVHISQWVGRITLNPGTDNWFETEVAPALVVNVEGNYNTLLQANKDAIGTVYNAWQTQWSGVVDSSSTSNSVDDGRGTITTVTRTTNTVRNDISRTGMNTQVLEKIDRISQGFKVIQQAMVPFCRSRALNFDGEGFFPNTRVYAFFDGKPVSVYCQPSDGYSDQRDTIPAVGDPMVTDAIGDVKGVFTIPDPKNPDNPKYQTGEITFRLTDSLNDTKSIQPYTAGETTYIARGRLDTAQETIFATRNATVVQTSLSQSSATFDTVTNTVTSTQNYDWQPPTPPMPPNEPDWGDTSEGGDDGADGADADGGGCKPLAQTFMIHAGIINPDFKFSAVAAETREMHDTGQFITSVDLFFGEKDPTVPIRVEIRNTVNGFPGGRVMPFATASVKAEDINLSLDATAATTWTFPSPVFLEVNTEYSIVVLGPSVGHKIWVARLGETEVGGKAHVTSQPHLGIMYVSHNDTGWAPSLLEDIKFNLYTARFDKTRAGTVTLQNKSLPLRTLDKDPLVFTNGNTALKVLHKGHHMYSSINNVTIAGTKSEAATTLNGAITVSDTSLTLTSGTNFDDTSGRYKYNSSSEWFIKIDDEIMKYTAISTNAVSSITRAQGGTIAASHADGAIVELYSLHGTPLTEINKTFTAISNIEIDSYTVLLTSAPVIGGAGVAENGGVVVTASENAMFNTGELAVSTLILDHTAIQAKIRPTTGTSPSGTETSFSRATLANATVVPIDDNYDYDSVQMICSDINETNELGGEKSLNFPITLTSERENLSPVIDVARMAFIAVGNRLNKVNSSADIYPTTDYVSSNDPDGDQNAAIYMTKRVTLETPATALKIFFGAYRHSTADIKVMYKILRTDDASNFDDLGWNYFNTTGADDLATPASLTKGNFREYKYSAGVTDDGIGTSLDEFIQFSIKIVMQGTNTSEVPIIKDLRCIALAT
jgi:hypothetical protein